MKLTKNDIGTEIMFNKGRASGELVGHHPADSRKWLVRDESFNLHWTSEVDASPIPDPEERAQKVADEINERLGDFQAEIWPDNGVEPGKRISLFHMPITIEQAERLLGWKEVENG